MAALRENVTGTASVVSSWTKGTPATPSAERALVNVGRVHTSVIARADNGRLRVQVAPTSGTPQPEMTVVFYGPDRAVVTDGSDKGQSVEFIRADGQVQWIRVTGRIAKRQPAP